MIIGSGLIATAFLERAGELEGVCVFASGVANSMNKDEKEFLRESSMLKNSLNSLAPNDQFVYFSTCSVYDKMSIDTAYVQHKIKMESIVLQRPRSHVFRLPQLAGLSRNGNTLLNYINSSIERGELMRIWSKAERNIIDVSDVVSVVIHLLRASPQQNLLSNICNPTHVLVLDLVKKLEEIKGRKARLEVVDGGGAYVIPLGDTIEIYSKIGLNFQEGYISSVLKKYYSNRVL
ncbi:NAD-dependent dehydratase [Diaphorobacter sp. HDW4A]|uniref:NAD-dependent epimerase/dehydratase family protein n=1 Tax=Diaphorobacter sp. HDW4A TaxID=2714924 RepID=UPI0014089557|nr:NAD-dependent epimerase/dehydratase family protein [Diaphorobacter sp. HDW4A]QIL81647.1 NAD-dependent dehydratase [Diaphorobacter sp. HDW4A]